MPIPDFQTIMLPLLKSLSDGKEHHLGEIIEKICAQFKLTDQERQALLPSGKQAVIDNRVGWARTYLFKAGLIESPKRGHHQITQRGAQLLEDDLQRIDIKFLERFPEFIEFRTIKKEQSEDAWVDQIKVNKKIEEVTPDELIEDGFNSIQASLGQELLSKIRASSPSFFEKTVKRLLESMGYGEGKITGQSGDGGIDGYIYQDKLGLDKILFQAKRFGEGTPVTPSMLRDFIGTLTTSDASKGVFITTSRFPKDAENIISRCPKPLKLIDAPKLIKLMIEFNIGASPSKVYEIKRIDSDFFDEE